LSIQVDSEDLKPKLDKAILKLSRQCADKHAAWVKYRDEGFQSWWGASTRMHKDLDNLERARERCGEMETTVIDDDIIALLV